MIQDIITYFVNNGQTYLTYVGQHLSLSIEALVLACVLALPMAYFSYEKPWVKQVSTLLTQGLRVIPSLGILFILIPFIGVGRLPALIALVILGIPPILLQTIIGFESVSDTLVETALGLGMTKWQLLTKFALPLALPRLLGGIKLALVELIASTTLATYIGAGGLGTLIFTGLGLYRYDLLLIGGGSVALLSFVSMVVFDLAIKGVTHDET